MCWAGDCHDVERSNIAYRTRQWGGGRSQPVRGCRPARSLESCQKRPPRAVLGGGPSHGCDSPTALLPAYAPQIMHQRISPLNMRRWPPPSMISLSANAAAFAAHFAEAEPLHCEGATVFHLADARLQVVHLHISPSLTKLCPPRATGLAKTTRGGGGYPPQPPSQQPDVSWRPRQRRAKLQNPGAVTCFGCSPRG